MNRGELEATLAGDYLHRDDMASAIATAIAMAPARIGRDLRSPLNYQIASTVAAPGLQLLGVAELRRIQINGKPVNIGTVDAVRSMQASGVKGAPLLAALDGRYLITAPALTDGDAVQYEAYIVPTLGTTPTSTNPVLENAPQLYIYGCLIDLAAMALDGELLGLAQQQFANEINAHNALAQSRGVGSAPAMRRV